MSKLYVCKNSILEIHQNRDGSYVTSKGAVLSSNALNADYVLYNKREEAVWNFIFSRKVDVNLLRYQGLPADWENNIESGFECSNCGEGGCMCIGEDSDIDEATAWSIHDERTPFCPNCGALMTNWQETYEEWKEKKNNE